MNSNDNGIDEETGLFNQSDFRMLLEEAFHSAALPTLTYAYFWSA